ncbi:MAG: tryptophan synthase subunit alpha [Dehalococcoidia bacterium]
MSQRLRDQFAKGKAEGRPLFVGYVTGGYPDPSETVGILLAMQAGGTDVIEMGVPFTDPLADGATIQHANQIALGRGMSLRRCFELVAEARTAGLTVPVLLMGYDNPIVAFGEERAAETARASGVDGFIIVDLPPEEAGRFLAACKANDQSFVPLVAPTTTDKRIPLLAAVADAFIYCVSVTGTTGSKSADPKELAAFIARVRSHTSLPLAVGFGVRKREDVAAIGKIAEAAVIGSAIIGAIDAAAAGEHAQRVKEFVEDVTGHKRA